MTDLGSRMTRLETKFDERWDAHDIRSEDNWSSIEKKLDSIEEKLIKMPCIDHIKAIDTNTNFRKGASKGLWILFSAIVGLIAKVFFYSK
jgi:hypothetical protein